LKKSIFFKVDRGENDVDASLCDAGIGNDKGSLGELLAMIDGDENDEDKAEMVSKELRVKTATFSLQDEATQELFDKVSKNNSYLLHTIYLTVHMKFNNNFILGRYSWKCCEL
jgi:hypothetical protein